MINIFDKQLLAEEEKEQLKWFALIRNSNIFLVEAKIWIIEVICTTDKPFKQFIEKFAVEVFIILAKEKKIYVVNFWIFEKKSTKLKFSK